MTTNTLMKMRQQGERIAMLTAYDYSIAKLLDIAKIDVILVGDSAANVMAGYKTTLPITLNEMIYHASSVVRAVKRALVVVDMPFGTYQGNSKEALNSAIRIMKESGADAIKLEGGAEVIESIDRILSGIDGLVIPGGEDVHPFLYGEEPDPHFGTDCLERDYFEIALIRLAHKRGIPILAACRGMQVTNVALGGTLCQDIPSADYSPKVQHGQWSATSTPHHSITIEKGSQLYAILGAKAQVNSTHHQCVRQPAPGMRIVATAPDGVPEAMEGDGILCVQFHPEAMIVKHPEMLGIYKWIVDKASRRK